MISIDNMVTVVDGYKAVKSLTVNDTLFDPKSKAVSKIKDITTPVERPYYRIFTTKLFPLDCTSDTWILTTSGFLKPADLCARCFLVSPIGEIPIMRVMPIVEPLLVSQIIPEDATFLIVVNGVYISCDKR